MTTIDHTDHITQAVRDWKRDNAYIAELKEDIADFRFLVRHGVDQRQRDWAALMLRSCEQELFELEAGRLHAPTDWNA